VTAVHSASALLAARTTALVAMYEDIACTRMAGLPVVHAALRVQAVGFAAPSAEPGMALGVLITPWFMSLVRLPLDAAAREAVAAPRQRARRRIGTDGIDFIGHDDPPIGAFETCSLFSPMHELADQAAAVAVAEQVLLMLRQSAAVAPQQPARRGFLLGRPGARAA
jgi:[NiFe] hydrogenase assembly HybE family chaperone